MTDNKTEQRTTAEAISEYANLLWHWSWLLVLLAILSGGLAYFISNRGTRIYQSSTLVMIGQTTNNQLDSYYTALVGQQMASTYSQVMTTKPILDRTAQKLGLTSFPETALVHVQPVPNTQLMTVTVQDVDPNQAALIANTLVGVFADQIKADQTFQFADTEKSLVSQMADIKQQVQDTVSQITLLAQKNQEISNSLAAINEQILADTRTSAPAETIDADKSTRDQLQIALTQNQSQLGQLQTTQAQYQQSYNAMFQSLENVKLSEAQNTSIFVQKDPAVPGEIPVRPQPVRNAMLAILFGLIITAGIVVLIEYLDDSIRDPQQITQRWGVPVLGMIVNFRTSNDGALITTRHPRSPVSEAFRSLRTNLQFASVDAPIRTLLVTSPSASDGKTTIAANLATVIAQSGRNVVIVDADLRRPSVHKIFQLSNRIGLADQFIKAQDHFEGALKDTETTNLHAITSGNLPPNPSELLGSGRMTEILHALSDQFNTVIVDTPPTLLVTDALVLGSLVDGVLLVVKPSVTKWAALKQVIDQLQHNKANLLGIVINNVNINRSGNYYYRGYYQHRYGKGYHYYSDLDSVDQAAKSKASVSESSDTRTVKSRNSKKAGKYKPE